MQKKFCRRLLSLALTGMAFLAQSQNPLKVGDALPKQFWETPLQMVNTPQKSTTLSADKDKLILLDFWATWCGSCLKNFPKMEALQKEFGEQVKIVPVTKEDRATLDKFFASKNGQRYKTLSSVVEDKMLTGFFPHYTIPYIVWIRNGKVVNTTDALQVSPSTVREILQDKTSSLQTVLQIDRSRPLMLSENFDLEREAALMSYSLLSKGKIRAIAPGSGFHRKDGLVIGRQWTNISLMNIYRGIAYELFEKSGDLFSEKRIINNIKNTAPIDFVINNEDEPVDDRLYSYEFVVPADQADGLYQLMLDNLNHFSGYSGVVKKQMVRCLVLRRTTQQDNVKTKDADSKPEFTNQPLSMKNSPFEYLIVALNSDSRLSPLPVIDETGYRGNVDMDLRAAKDMTSLQKVLQHYGLELAEANREILMLQMSDHPST